MRFESYLAEVERRLTVPYPERRDLVLELGEHLESLYEEYLSGGMAPERARAKAIATLDLDGEFRSSIDLVHRTLVARVLDLLPRRLAMSLEAAGIGLIGAVMVSVVAREALMIDFILNGGIFMIPINLAGIAIVVIAIERIYSLFIKRDHGEGNLSRRLTSLKFLGLGCTLIGLLGTLMGLYQAFTVVGDRIGVDISMVEVARIALTTSIWGMTLSLIALVAYSTIRLKVEGIRRMQAGA